MADVSIKDEGTIKRLDGFLKVLADQNRLRILKLLSYGELCVCEIFGKLDLPQNLVSHHLARLEKAGLLEKRKESTFIIYSIDRKTVKKCKSLFNNIIKD